MSAAVRILVIAITLPSAGRCAAHLQLVNGGALRTARFTVEEHT